MKFYKIIYKIKFYKVDYKIEKHRTITLKVGDLIRIYIKRGEHGASMGPSIEFNHEYMRWVVFGGNVYTDDMCHAYYMDTKEPIGMPIQKDSIFEVRVGEGLHIMRDIMIKAANKNFHWHIRSYVDLFNEFPLHIGTHVTIASTGQWSYKTLNKKKSLPCKHKVLQSDDLIVLRYLPLQYVAEVMSISTKKTALVAIEAINGTKYPQDFETYEKWLQG